MQKDRIFKIRQQIRERIPFSLGLLGVLAFVLFLTYLLGYVNQMNTLYKYTYLEPINDTGVLTSNRLKPIWWTEFLASIFRLLFLFMTVVRVALYKEPWVINIHILVTAIYMVVEIAGSVLYGVEYECCNNSPLDESCSGENNCCNDYRWCCAYGHLTDSCLNVLQSPYNCTPNVTSSNLKPNIEFAISFSLTLGHALLGILALCLSYAARKTLLVKREYLGPVDSTRQFDDGFYGIGGKYDNNNDECESNGGENYSVGELDANTLNELKIN
jgi:hypothetical protein